MKLKIKKAFKTTLMCISVLIVITAGAFYIYTLDYYRADASALTSIASAGDHVSTSGDMTVFYPEYEMDRSTAFIFYPGGKVEAAAYAPLLTQLSKNGITCILLKMPFNLAVFNVNAADNVFSEFPQIKNWYLGGHSLGGAMASSYAGKNSDRLNGLILLGAYPVNDSTIPTLVLYGSEDINLDLTKLMNVENKIEIPGGNHAYFGNYGEQKGDGTAAITRAEQQEKALSEIIRFISEG